MKEVELIDRICTGTEWKAWSKYFTSASYFSYSSLLYILDKEVTILSKTSDSVSSSGTNFSPISFS